MSGILGIWNSCQPAPWQAMLADLTAFGPDRSGQWHDADLGLRLGRTQSFNTPESSLEAPVVEAEGCILVWDGRLDDRPASKGARSWVTDAQLLIESYRRWGVDCLQHLIGEYVFILWDQAQQQLVVGCDGVGGRTIAYYWDGATLLLSSRLLSLLRHPQVSHDLDELYVAHSLCHLQAHPPEITPFQSLKRLLPGHALVLKHGRLSKQTIAPLRPPEYYWSADHPEQYYEQFWELLERSLQDRLRTGYKICSTLSGGLDSTMITAGLLKYLPNVDALSYVTDRFPEFDERQPIQTFLNHYPSVKWHGIDCNQALTLSEPWKSLPAMDDPILPCTFAMHLRMIEYARQQGFQLIFDGDWGDELCYNNLQDQIHARNWLEVGRTIVTHPHRHSLLWRDLIMPRLPEAWLNPWWRYQTQKSNLLADWIDPDYQRSQSVQLALQQSIKTPQQLRQVDAFRHSITSGACVGSTQSYRFLQATYQLECTSPLQDRRLLEFCSHLHPRLQNNATQEKLFLREANRGILPEEIRSRPKGNYFDPLKYAGLGQGETVLDLLEAVKKCDILRPRIDFQKFEDRLFQYRREYSEQYSPWMPVSNSVANKMLAVIAFYKWHTNFKDHVNFSRQSELSGIS